MLAFLFAILAFALPLAASAEDAMEGEAIVEHIFDVADSNADGVIVFDEYEDARLGAYGLTFEQCDTNQDGVLALDEYLDLYTAHHPAIGEDSI